MVISEIILVKLERIWTKNEVKAANKHLQRFCNQNDCCLFVCLFDKYTYRECSHDVTVAMLEEQNKGTAAMLEE